MSKRSEEINKDLRTLKIDNRRSSGWHYESDSKLVFIGTVNHEIIEPLKASLTLSALIYAPSRLPNHPNLESLALEHGKTGYNSWNIDRLAHFHWVFTTTDPAWLPKQINRPLPPTLSGGASRPQFLGQDN